MKRTQFYTDSKDNNIDPGFALEKSKTTVLSLDKLNPNVNSIFDNNTSLYSRPAPSPPVRKKLSPSSRRAEILQQAQLLQKGKNLAQTGILDSIPVPPRRKISPRLQNLTDINIEGNVASGTSDKSSVDEDLIKF